MRDIARVETIKAPAPKIAISITDLPVKRFVKRWFIREPGGPIHGTLTALYP
jgi:hypothetical protein